MDCRTTMKQGVLNVREVNDFLQMLLTGQAGSFTSLHGASGPDAFNRLIQITKSVKTPQPRG